MISFLQHIFVMKQTPGNLFYLYPSLGNFTIHFIIMQGQASWSLFLHNGSQKSIQFCTIKNLSRLSQKVCYFGYFWTEFNFRHRTRCGSQTEPNLIRVRKYYSKSKVIHFLTRAQALEHTFSWLFFPLPFPNEHVLMLYCSRKKEARTEIDVTFWERE